jgi:hypothetical protein
MKEEAVKARDGLAALHLSLIFLNASRELHSIDSVSLKRAERLELSRLKRAREGMMLSFEATLLGEKKAEGLVSKGGPAHLKFTVPERVSGFGKTLKELNNELYELHSDQTLPNEIRFALDSLIESLNSLILSDASDIPSLHRSKQYLASLKLFDFYEGAARIALTCARSRDLSGMLKLSDSLGVNLPALLYKKGVYLKISAPPAEAAAKPLKKL